MARTDNLNNFLTDVADAIREKKGTDEPIQASNFDTEIASIPSGGGGDNNIKGDFVLFVDHTGEVIAGYREEDLPLTKLPEPKQYDGLVFQQWNWTLDEINTTHEATVVGANYVTDDGHTRLYIHHDPTDTDLSIAIGLNKRGGTSFVVDWGDETQEIITTNGEHLLNHEYLEAKDYVINIYSENDATYYLVASGYNQSVVGKTMRQKQKLTKVETGDGVKRVDAFDTNYSLESISVSTSVTDGPVSIPNNKKIKVLISPAYPHISGSYVKYVSVKKTANQLISNRMSNVPCLEYIYISSNVTSYDSSTIQGFPLKYLSGFPNVTRLYNWTFNGLNVETINMPDTVTGTSGSSFYSLPLLKNIRISRGLSTLPNQFCQNCYSLKKLYIPPNIVTIGYSFLNFTAAGTSSIKECHFDDHTQIPTLNGTCFQNVTSDFKIYVPASLYDDWIAASEWVNYASYIVPVEGK